MFKTSFKVFLIAIVAMVAVIGALYMVMDMGDKTAVITRDVFNANQVEEGGEVVVVGVISDTHIPTRAKEIPPEVFEVFEGADYIIHAGDFVEMEVIEQLERIAPVYAVHGNMDSYKVKGKLPEINSLEVHGWHIGVIHDSISPWRMRKMRGIAIENGFDVLIFGHTHRAYLKEDGGRLYLNPGSPTNPLLSKPSVAVLRISEDKIEAEIVDVG